MNAISLKAEQDQQHMHVESPNGGTSGFKVFAGHKKEIFGLDRRFLQVKRWIKQMQHEFDQPGTDLDLIVDLIFKVDAYIDQIFKRSFLEIYGDQRTEKMNAEDIFNGVWEYFRISGGEEVV